MKYFIDMHGCAKNQVDAEILQGILSGMGMEKDDSPDPSPDLIIINTCSFIESAKAESISSVIAARRDHPSARIIVTGCLSQRYGKLLVSMLPEADGYFGNGDLSLFSSFVKELLDRPAGKEPLVLIPGDRGVSCGERPFLEGFPGSAFLKVTEGCDNCCSFCAIPLIRGHLRSRRISEIIAEAESLISRGVFEINLIGQDLASFGIDLDSTGEEYLSGKENQEDVVPRGKPMVHKGKTLLPKLLEAFSALDLQFRLRLLYIHPDNFPLEILPVIKKDKRILPYFDLPFQHGSDRILKLMNRKGSLEKYCSLIGSIRKELPEAVFRTTFMTGFPGEKKADFLKTRELQEKILPLWSGTFEYSLEDDTPAEKFPGRVFKFTASKRRKILEENQEKITAELLKSFIGTVQEFFAEEIIPEENLALGRCWFQAPEVDGVVVLSFEETDSLEPGKIYKVRLVGVSGIDLKAVLVR